jgi:hypothetical protein
MKLASSRFVNGAGNAKDDGGTKSNHQNQRLHLALRRVSAAGRAQPRWGADYAG